MKAAWFAAILAAFNPFLAQYSQEARMYSLVALLAIPATACFLRAYALDVPNRRPWIAGFAVSVAVSTRFGLALNITVVVAIYIAANLARYATGVDLPAPVHALVAAITAILPGLSNLDLNQRLVFGDFNLGNTRIVAGLPSYGQIWAYVAFSAAYAAMYISAALCFGIALFRTRELS